MTISVSYLSSSLARMSIVSPLFSIHDENRFLLETTPFRLAMYDASNIVLVRTAAESEDPCHKTRVNLALPSRPIYIENEYGMFDSIWAVVYDLVPPA